MQKRCYICSGPLKKKEQSYRCKCNIKIHEDCASDIVHCPVCGRFLIFVTDPTDTLGG